ncbi:hypothetical protein I204_03694 [Kwoniella mangroviensis CBS 8886]|uniref:uncharacterized protein n=1 Tax=Kwoniella mangroviensis CBS 8507 TaxID=1296122 RepID=UPI00080D7D60|nr:uncharacterized protein I203_02838 [Kwoniella mangroviensis CBS 8507]OCF68176.1 hypothetical protein I203_02838 [Kwoniella mangroviensis CBS 8507]OCF74852.1 hypothetical protein I204_03694 [Kwoniella mangroviensis CBS 8886]
MPYISNETLIGAALLIVLAFGYQYLPSSGPTSTHHSQDGSASKSSKKRAKKKANRAVNVGGPSKGHKEADAIALGQRPEKPKGASIASGQHEKAIRNTKGGGGLKEEANKASMGLSEEKGPQATISSGEKMGKKPKKRLLAERLLPKEPKTKVDDMLAPEDRPGAIARVMKVTSSSKDKSTSNSFAAFTQPASTQDDEESEEDDEKGVSSGVENGNENGKIAKFEGDYVDLSDNEDAPKKVQENDGWDVVTSKKKKSTSLNISSDPFASHSTSTSLPLPPGAASRQQKKNAKKAEGKKLAREAEEAERQRRLALHKKDLEKERINELYASKQSNPNRGKALGKTGNSNSKATLNENGKLVWD